jgi:CBS domain-containing protein
MQVSQILKAKAAGGSAPATAVTTVSPDGSVLDAVKLLAEKRIGAVVVASADRAVAGILSERDIVRVLATTGPDVLDRRVSEVMTRSVVTCSADTSIDDLMAMMTRGRFRHLPVVDDADRLIGIISIGDVVKNHVEEITHEATALRDYIATH